jgi:aspartate/methionine/tyrosine aminotransferase
VVGYNKNETYCFWKEKMIKVEDINERIINAQYAVRGSIVTRAQELEREGRSIIYCNIGNPHTFAQRPLTYVREVLSLLEFPKLINEPESAKLFHSDSLERAKYIFNKIPEGVGAYTPSAGIEFIREAVADFISKRDNIPATNNRIILTDGASKAAQSIMESLIKGPDYGIMIPIPQYPLYSATLTLLDGAQIDYYLDENNGWQLDLEELEESLSKAKARGIKPVAITVINPGNPTGAVLSRDNIEMIIDFARAHNLTILADEVYQNNIYGSKSFYSFAQVMHQLDVKDVSLISIHSMSKGFFGECGHRSGYLEARNVTNEVFAQFVKLQSINLCANTIGQLATYLMVTPPKPGDASYALYEQEKQAILNDLKEKSKIIGDELNKIPGISVSYPEGAMYAFVKLDLPSTANTDTVAEDEKYCMALLEETGICVVPGSGFGQYPGTLHFRTTFLPPREEIISLITRLKQFHMTYTQSY